MIAQAVRGLDAEARLARALERNARAEGVTATVRQCRSRPWSSATFEGVQVDLSVQAGPADAAMAWLAALAEAQLPMAGHVAMPPAIDAAAALDDGLLVALSVLVLIDG